MSMRPVSSSFRIALALCASTVFTLSARRAAISLLLYPGRDQPEDFRFALAEACPGLGRPLAFFRKKSGGDAGRQRRIEVLSAGRRGPDGLDQLRRRALLEDVARHARPQQFLQVGVVAVAGERDDRRISAAAL